MDDSLDDDSVDDDCSHAARISSLRPNFLACEDDGDADRADSEEYLHANESDSDSSVGRNEVGPPATAEVPPDALAIVPRGHRLHLPRTGRLITHISADFLWRWEPDDNSNRGAGCIQMMTDFTLAAHKAVRQLWGSDVDYLLAMCGFHTWAQWKKKHIGLFRNAAKNASRCRNDFEAYRCSPWPALIPILILKMVENSRVC
jgi:hypothetical protein